MENLKEIYDLVSAHADRLGIDKDIAFENALSFADTVGTLENEGRLVGKNPKSTAKGLYQFIDGSVGPAKNRLRKYIDIEGMPDDPNEMTWKEQTLLFLGDVLEKKGSDKLMRKVLEDASDTEAVKQAYYVLHHTAPDEQTKGMVERKMRKLWNSRR